MSLSDEQLDLWGKKILFKLENGNLQQRLKVRFLKGIAARTTPEQNMDCIVAYCGERGMGKSNGAILDSVLLRQFGMDFNFDDIYYGQDSLNSAVQKIATTKRRVYVFDEMIDLAYSRNAMTTLNKKLGQFFTKVRKMNNIIFLCVPRFKTLDSALRDDVVHFWIEVFWKSHARTRADKFALSALFKKNRSPVSTDPWGIEEKRVMYLRAYNPAQHLKLMKKIPSYRACLSTPPLPEVLEDAYLKTAESYIGEAGQKFIDSFEKKKKKKVEKPEPNPA